MDPELALRQDDETARFGRQHPGSLRNDAVIEAGPGQRWASICRLIALLA
jgi:hypothetical protein